jgi:hypothetical protein
MSKDASGRSPWRSLASFAAAALFVLALSFAIVWPLWSLATKERGAFNLAVLAVAALIVAYFVGRHIVSRILRLRARARRAQASDIAAALGPAPEREEP